jgi:tetratricopeptide (TPR) repeat protein
VAFEKAVKLTPRGAHAQNMPGQVMLQQGDVEGAIPHFRTVTQLKPTLPVAHAYLAQALESNGQMDDATAEFRVPVQLAPKQPEAHRALGRALGAQQKTDEAIEEFKAAVRLAPSKLNYTASWVQRCNIAVSCRDKRDANLRIRPLPIRVGFNSERREGGSCKRISESSGTGPTSDAACTMNLVPAG